MMKPSLVAALGAGLALPACGLLIRYRRGTNAARARLTAVDRHVVSTEWGAVEYAEQGHGDPVLVVHGIFHNCVGGLLSVRGLVPDRRVIAPSRFGYLGSSMPPNATPAQQADAFASLLDALDIDQVDVICESAGATSALQLALRHPERVKHLAVLVGNLPGSPTAVVQPSAAKLFNRQLPLWVLRTVAPSMMVRLVAGLPKEFAMSRDDARFITEFIDSLFPVSPEGVDFDAFVSNAAVNDYNLEGISVPTLIVHTKDDQLASHDASERAAQRIPGARFVSLESGGHLMIGQTKIVRDELADFFAETSNHARRGWHLERRRQEDLMRPTLIAMLTLSVLYWFPIRRWMSRWGATSSDLTRVMAGDALLVNPAYSGTMAVTVDARPEHIWPWLVQIGYQRGGLYSYDWLDRLFGYLDRPSATRILPEFQNLAVGDKIPVGQGPSWPVAVIEPNRALVLDMRNMGGFDWVWQFGLYPVNEHRTELVSRSCVRTRNVWARLATYVIEPAGFLMTRRMLLGLKQRAETLRAANMGEMGARQRPAA